MTCKVLGREVSRSMESTEMVKATNDLQFVCMSCTVRFIVI